MQQIKKRQIAAQAKGQEDQVDQLESKIVEQETDISNMENRNYFSLHCLQLETQLVHANLKMLAIVLQKMVASQVIGHKEVSVIFETLSYCATGKTVNTWNISRMLVMLWPITAKIKTPKLDTKPQTN